MSGSFSSSYRAWLDARLDKDKRRTERAERRLSQLYRRAWVSNDSHERGAVLNFILVRREVDGVDLVVEGLGSADPYVASTAAVVASALIHWRIDMGPTIRRDLEEFASRFPQWDAISWAALQALDDREKPDA